MRSVRFLGVVAAALLLAATAACGGDDDGGGGGDDAPLGGALAVRGTVVDFLTDMPVDGATSVSASGLTPAPKITVQGAGFEIADVPENSTFHALAASAPSHRATFGPALVVASSAVEDMKLPVMSEAYVGTLAQAFGVTPQASHGILVVQVVDENDAPRAGVKAGDLMVAGNDGQVLGPFFLDQDRQPAPQATETSASGYIVWFALAPGLTGMFGAPSANLTVDMPVSPVAAGAVTLGRVRVIAGPPAAPMNVSFAQQIVPIFERRGCQACHSGSGIGKDLGGLTLDGGTNLIYRELVQERPTRVVVAAPAQSLVLTMPSREDPADGHPNVTFASPQDPDYVLLEAWIQQGAKQN